MRKFMLRKVKPEDLDAVEIILAQGREFLRGQGLPQWQDGYGPGREDAAVDISRGEGFALVNAENGKICGYAALVKGEDEYYTAIRGLNRRVTPAREDGENTGGGREDGENAGLGIWDETWPEYISVHRLALSAETRGKGAAKIFMAELILEAARQGFRDIRVDTYEGNLIMRRVIEGAGFVLKGEIEFPFPNGERLAYQLLV